MMNRATMALLSAGLWGVLTVGCSNKAINNDDSLKTDIQAKLYADPATKGGHVGVDVKDGVVTLTGDVPSSDVELAAMKIANGTTGVRSVSDQMKINGALAQDQLPDAAANLAKNTQTANGTPPAPKTSTPPPITAAPAPEPPAPAPVRERAAEPVRRPTQSVQGEEEPSTATVAAGERLSVRTTEMIDSGKATEGQRYRASLDAPLTSRGRVIVPAGAPVTLEVTGVQGAGRIKGNSILSLRPTSLEYGGRNYPINGSVYSEEGKARGKNTAVKTGIGAAAGALIGGLAGGGKGAAIGAGAGGGAGFGWNALSHGQQVKIPAESVLSFRLQAPLTVPVR
jgi:BON domain